MAHVVLPRRPPGRKDAGRKTTLRPGGGIPGSVAAVCSLVALLSLAPRAAADSVSILVAGSVNADTFLPVDRFPSPGENLTLLPGRRPREDVPGGKGCNQAVAASRLGGDRGVRTAFLGRFGDDPAGTALERALVGAGVDMSPSRRCEGLPSGRGYVLVLPDGEVCAVVSGGSNSDGWSDLLEDMSDGDLDGLVSSHSLLMLQCEVPPAVNLRLARAARRTGVPVLLDAGGEDRDMDCELLECCSFLIPNETELGRLARRMGGEGEGGVKVNGGLVDAVLDAAGPHLDRETVVSSLSSARTLQNAGASNVLVTLGSRGSLLLRPGGSSAVYRPPCPLSPPAHPSSTRLAPGTATGGRSPRLSSAGVPRVGGTRGTSTTGRSGGAWRARRRRARWR